MEGVAPRHVGEAWMGDAGTGAPRVSVAWIGVGPTVDEWGGGGIDGDVCEWGVLVGVVDIAVRRGRWFWVIVCLGEKMDAVRPTELKSETYRNESQAPRSKEI